MRLDLSELSPDHVKDLWDIAIRVRGYTRYLSVVEDDGEYTGQSDREGVYRLPASAGIAHPYLTAEVMVTSDQDLDLLLDEEKYWLGLSDGDRRHFTLVVGAEPDANPGFVVELRDGRSGYGDLNAAMARRILQLLNQLDSLIPQLIPDLATQAGANKLLAHFHHAGERVRQFGS